MNIYDQVKRRIEQGEFQNLTRARQSISRAKLSEPKREELRMLAQSFFTTGGVMAAARASNGKAGATVPVQPSIVVDSKLEIRMKAAAECYKQVSSTAERHGVSIKTLCTDLVHLDVFYRQMPDHTEN